jgi:hypothetical protein
MMINIGECKLFKSKPLLLLANSNQTLTFLSMNVPFCLSFSQRNFTYEFHIKKGLQLDLTFLDNIE